MSFFKKVRNVFRKIQDLPRRVLFGKPSQKDLLRRKLAERNMRSFAKSRSRSRKSLSGRTGRKRKMSMQSGVSVKRVRMNPGSVDTNAPTRSGVKIGGVRNRVGATKAFYKRIDYNTGSLSAAVNSRANAFIVPDGVTEQIYLINQEGLLNAASAYGGTTNYSMFTIQSLPTSTATAALQCSYPRIPHIAHYAKVEVVSTSTVGQYVECIAFRCKKATTVASLQLDLGVGPGNDNGSARTAAVGINSADVAIIRPASGGSNAVLPCDDPNFNYKDVPSWNAQVSRVCHFTKYLPPGCQHSFTMPLSKNAIDYKKLGLFAGTYDLFPGTIFFVLRTRGQLYKANTTSLSAGYAPCAISYLCTQYRILAMPTIIKPKRLISTGTGSLASVVGTANATNIVDPENDDPNAIENI